MIIACIVLSGLALLAATVNIILFFREKKRAKAEFARIETWRKTALDYIESADETTLTSAREFAEELITAFAEDIKSENKAFREGYCIETEEKIQAIEGNVEALSRDIEELKKGTCPDYEQALSAAKAVNDFNRGISGILNFDPIEAARRLRLNSEGGDE